MNKNDNKKMEDELLSEYDFAQMQGGVKGKYVERYRAETTSVVLNHDVAQTFANRLFQDANPTKNPLQ